jgi:hypothetical protein
MYLPHERSGTFRLMSFGSSFEIALLTNLKDSGQQIKLKAKLQSELFPLKRPLQLRL